jgi:hypothetical protein
MSSLQQNWRKAQNSFCLEARRVDEGDRGQGGEMTQIIYAHMNKEKYSCHRNKKPPKDSAAHVRAFLSITSLTIDLITRSQQLAGEPGDQLREKANARLSKVTHVYNLSYQ